MEGGGMLLRWRCAVEFGSPLCCFIHYDYTVVLK